MIKSFGIPLDKISENSVCRIANGNTFRILGLVTLPVSVADKERLISVLVVPDIPNPLILGIDFFKQMVIVPDLRHDVCYFSEDVSAVCIVKGATNEESVLTTSQEHELNQLLSRHLKLFSEKL